MAINPKAKQLINEYIAEAPDFAKPICSKLRGIIHKADPEIAEDWKWGPNFNKSGMVCGFGAFQKHVTLVFFQGALLKDPEKILEHGGSNQHTRSVKFTNVVQIDQPTLISYIKEAVSNNENGIRAKPSSKKLTIPEDLNKALSSNKKALGNFNNFAYTYRKEYILWIKDAKKQETREKRLKEAIKKLAQGKKINEKYM